MPPPADQEELLSAKVLFSVAGALWAFFALSLFTFLKDIVLADLSAKASREAIGYVKPIVGLMFLVNFSTLAVVQTVGVIVLQKSVAKYAWIPWFGSIVSLVIYVLMATLAYRAVSAALRT